MTGIRSQRGMKRGPGGQPPVFAELRLFYQHPSGIRSQIPLVVARKKATENRWPDTTSFHSGH